MPTYEYLCDNCENTFEQMQSITAKALRKCPQCGKLKLRRLIGSGAGIIFKGSGFYETDYRSDSYNKGRESEKTKTSEKKTETQTGAKSEIKSETTSESKSPESKPPDKDTSKSKDKKKTA